MLQHPLIRTGLLAAVSALALTACEQTMTTDNKTNGEEIVVTGSKSQEERMEAEAPPPPVAPSPMIMMERAAVGGAMADMAMASPLPPPHMQPPPGMENRDQFEDVEPNPVKSVLEEPVSTFSIDVDTAAYVVARKFLNEGRLPPKDAVRP